MRNKMAIKAENSMLLFCDGKIVNDDLLMSDLY